MTLCLVRRGYPHTVHVDLDPHPLDVDYPVPACLPDRREGDLYTHVTGPPTCERCLALGS
jgi:hypothetical protein